MGALFIQPGLLHCKMLPETLLFKCLLLCNQNSKIHRYFISNNKNRMELDHVLCLGLINNLKQQTDH